MPAIATEALTKLYGRHRGIEEVTLAVEEGDVFGLLGPNGAGKTTLIRTLLDLLHPTRGQAWIFGLDSRRDSVAIHARIGNLPGDFGFGTRTTGADAVRLLARLRGLDGTGRASELARRFRADLDRPLGQLSRGNRQKVGLILALFHEPELAILDEPTNGLDPLMQEEFLALVGEEHERGRTIVISSHELDEIERVCDKVAIVRDGKLVAVEHVPDLLSKTPRRVRVEFVDVPDVAGLRTLRGVDNVTVAGKRVTFTVAENLDAVVKAIAGGRVVDLEVTHPTLEEVFLTYYEDGAG